MILAALHFPDFQTLSDAVGLGAIYALMAVGIGLVLGCSDSSTSPTANW